MQMIIQIETHWPWLVGKKTNGELVQAGTTMVQLTSSHLSLRTSARDKGVDIGDWNNHRLLSVSKKVFA